MLEAVDDGLRFLFSGFLLFLNLNQEALKVSSGHKAILRVVVEKGLDLRRRLRHAQLEPPAAAEAHSVSLFRHASLPIPKSQLRIEKKAMEVYVFR